jgi:hypothetical protein
MGKVLFKPEEIKRIHAVATEEEAKDFRFDVYVAGAEPKTIRTHTEVKRNPMSRKALESIAASDKTKFNLSPQAARMLDETVAALVAGKNPSESFLEIRIKDANPPQKPPPALSGGSILLRAPPSPEEMASMKSELLASVMKPEGEVDYKVLCDRAHGDFYRKSDEFRQRLEEAARTIGAERRADVSLTDDDWKGELKLEESESKPKSEWKLEPEWKCKLRVAERLSRERGVEKYMLAAKEVLKDARIEPIF